MCRSCVINMRKQLGGEYDHCSPMIDRGLALSRHSVHFHDYSPGRRRLSLPPNDDMLCLGGLPRLILLYTPSSLLLRCLLLSNLRPAVFKIGHYLQVVLYSILQSISFIAMPESVSCLY